MIHFLLACSGSPPAPPAESPAREETVFLDGWELVRRERGRSRFFYQRPLRSRVNRLERVWEPVHTALQEELGQPPLLGVNWYIFSPADYDGALAMLAALDAPSVLVETGGRYHKGGDHPGIYLKSSRLETASETAEIAAHELAHAWEHELAHGRPVPAWFKEGLAEIIGHRAAELADPAGATRSGFADLAAMVGLERLGAMPALESLERNRDLEAEGRKMNAVYVYAQVATEEILAALGAGAARHILQAIGRGESLDQILAGRGLPREALEDRIDARIQALALQFPPGLHLEAVSAGELEVVWVGLAPGTPVSWTGRGPPGCFARESTRASVAGVASWTFGRVIPRACAGQWEVGASAPMIRDELAEVVWAPEPRDGERQAR